MICDYLLPMGFQFRADTPQILNAAAPACLESVKGAQQYFKHCPIHGTKLLADFRRMSLVPVGAASCQHWRYAH